MEMTIDERIAQITKVKRYAAPKHYETLNIAIDAMRKCQAIEQILSERPDEMIQSNPTLNAIRKVLEDEKV